MMYDIQQERLHVCMQKRCMGTLKLLWGPRLRKTSAFQDLLDNVGKIYAEWSQTKPYFNVKLNHIV